jgi:dynein heavy chain
VAYISPFTSEYRKELLNKWAARIKQLKIPIGDNTSIEKLLGDPIQIREWQNFGLPADELSIENAIIMTNCRRWPLLIDPQSQANKWIKNMKADQNLVKIKLTQQNFARYLENAIRFGNPVLLENVEETLDPVLEPVLAKQITKKGAQYLIKLGDQDIPYNQEFRFYMTTKMPNPHYVPEITIKVTLINFNVTPTGLDEQLLIEVFKNEKPELEELRDTLIVQISDDNKQLVDLQDKILRQIAEVQGNILDDEEIIITLGASKITSETINKRMVDAKATNESITKARNQYKAVSARGTILYFAIVDLSLIDPMYQWSLEFFITVFKRRLDQSEKSEDISQRKQILVDD